jgi:hypothetical protein
MKSQAEGSIEGACASLLFPAHSQCVAQFQRHQAFWQSVLIGRGKLYEMHSLHKEEDRPEGTASSLLEC